MRSAVQYISEEVEESVPGANHARRALFEWRRENADLRLKLPFAGERRRADPYEE